MGVGPFTLFIAHKATTNEEWEEFVESLFTQTGYVREKTRGVTVHQAPAGRR